MATTLGTDRQHTEDTPSETVKLLRTEFNTLLDFILSIVNAATTNGDTFQAAVNALDMTAIRKLVASRERPAAPANPTT